MDLTKQERRARRRFGVIPKWFELLAICAATIAAGFFGGRETVVRADDPKPAVTVTATATVTATPGSSTNAEDEPRTEIDPSDSGGPGHPIPVPSSTSRIVTWSTAAAM